MAPGCMTLTVNFKFHVFEELCSDILILFSFAVEEKKVKSLEHIVETRQKVKTEIATLKEKLQKTREKIAEFKESSAQNSTTQ